MTEYMQGYIAGLEKAKEVATAYGKEHKSECREAAAKALAYNYKLKILLANKEAGEDNER